MYTKNDELTERLMIELANLADTLDDVFESINAIMLWRVLNGFHGLDEDIRNKVSQFFSKDFGDATGSVLAELLLGPVEGD